MKPSGSDLHVSAFGPDRVLVYAQTYKAYQAVKACGDRRMMSVDELVVLIEALASHCPSLNMTALYMKQRAAAERETAAVIQRIRSGFNRNGRAP